MANESKYEKYVHRVDGQLYESFVIKDDDGKKIQQIDIPLKVELKIQDLLEILVGASILAVPVAFTEEVWNMGNDLGWFNIILLNFVSLIFMGSFMYFKGYRNRLEMYRNEYLKRLFSTFFLSVLIVAILLTIVGKCPWITDPDLALKRILIGSFPASMSATVTDSF
ncbi:MULTISPECIES: DUF2391 family protein [Lutimonas]|uniref:DUF2391 family protein n=1 Tax=Lutimonas TaxID=449810 RepID=UPI001CD50387|nr:MULTISPECIES: DUF2391 family protein [Lutimonas]MCA0933896.1 DUF2391 family protein [Lutimonas saemankumensis]WKK65096.1 DUF2391 family protein [Lutimonas sp. YSD2104]